MDVSMQAAWKVSRPYPLTDDIAYCPGDDDPIVLILIEVEVLFHARDKSIGKVGCIDLYILLDRGPAQKECLLLLTHLVNIPSVPKVKRVASN